MRTRVDWRSTSKDNYMDFCKQNPDIQISMEEWKNIIYSYNESFRNHILETGERCKLPAGLGEFSINKKKRKQFTDPVSGTDKVYVNLPIDWKKTKEKGKRIYNFNYHTEGYFFGWIWFKETAMFSQVLLWAFRPTRITSRLLAHYLKINDDYQHIYRQWKT